MLDPRRILVIEDDIGMADLLGDFCESMGYDVRCVTDPRDALRAAIDFRPHLITLDLEMPFVNGYDVLKQLRAHPATNGTPVVIVTGWADERKLQNIDVQAAMAKPVRYSAFSKNIHDIIQSRPH
jgi:DNA-binding response OmpR family regulator